MLRFRAILYSAALKKEYRKFSSSPILKDEDDDSVNDESLVIGGNGYGDWQGQNNEDSSDDELEYGKLSIA